MSGSPGDRNRPGAGGDSHPNKKRKFDLESDEGQRQRARDAYKLLENIQDVKSRGGPAFPPATEGQLHHVQAGFSQLETYQDGFNLDGPTGQVNWIGAVSHVNSATWGSRVALDNADALAALLSTMQAIGARENAPTVRLAMIFESDTEGKQSQQQRRFHSCSWQASERDRPLQQYFWDVRAIQQQSLRGQGHSFHGP